MLVDAKMLTRRLRMRGLGGPVVKTPSFHCRGRGFDPWSGNQDPISPMVQSDERRGQRGWRQESQENKEQKEC